MHVLVTGATGWIGSATVPALLAAGHTVTGLARSDASAQALVDAGAQVLRGSLDDLDLLRTAATDADATIHLAFKHEEAFSGDFPSAAAADRAAIEAIGAAGRPFAIATGFAGQPSGGLVTEDSTPDIDAPAGVRMHAERLALSLGGTSVRLSPTVHGEGDTGFVAALVGAAREHGFSAYVGDGTSTWPAVHRSDPAGLFRLAVESDTPGRVLHAAAEEGVELRAIAEAIGRGLGVPTRSITAEEAPRHFGWLGHFVTGIDVRASSALTRETLGWAPSGPTLLEDLDAGRYTALTG